jgi:hypothetical protein
MTSNISVGEEMVYRNGKLIRRVPHRGIEAKAKIDRELHGLVVRVSSATGRVPVECPDWFYDLRRKQLKVYGGLLRFIDVSVAQGTDKTVLLHIPELLRAYIEDCYGEPKKAA